MAYEYSNQGLMRLYTIEKAGNSPDMDISTRWSYQTMNSSEKYIVGVGILMDVSFIFIILLSTAYNLFPELRAFYNDPTDRLVLAGGYENENVDHMSADEAAEQKFTMKTLFAKLLNFGKAKAIVPDAFYNRILNIYDQLDIETRPTFEEWYMMMIQNADEITRGYVMAGIDANRALELSTDTSEMMTGTSGLVAAIMGDTAQTAAIMKTDMGDLVKNYMGEGGQMQTTQVVHLLHEMKKQGLSNEEMMRKLKEHAKTEKKHGYLLKNKYEGAAKAAKRRRLERKRRRHEAKLRNEKKHRRPTLTHKEFLRRGEGGLQVKQRQGQPARRKHTRKPGISIFMK